MPVPKDEVQRRAQKVRDDIYYAETREALDGLLELASLFESPAKKRESERIAIMLSHEFETLQKRELRYGQLDQGLQYGHLMERIIKFSQMWEMDFLSGEQNPIFPEEGPDAEGQAWAPLPVEPPRENRAKDLGAYVLPWPTGKAPPDSVDAVFSAKGIRRRFQSKGKSFELTVEAPILLKPGEILGLVGPNGSGKTTLLNIVAGEFALDEGTLHYGLEGNAPRDWRKLKTQISFVHQRPKKWSGSAKTNLHLTAALQGIRGKENHDLVNYFLNSMGLDSYSDARWKELSAGFQVRFELARALVRNPKLLLLDEPLAHLDIKVQYDFLQYLLCFARLRHMPIMVSSQHLHEIEAIADQIIFLAKGSVLYQGKTTDLGAQRRFNSFEIDTPLEKAALEKLVAGLPEVRVRDHTGPFLIVDTPISLEASQLLPMLIQSGVIITYFRDISRSTRNLFSQEGSGL